MGNSLEDILKSHDLEITPDWDTDKVVRLGPEWWIGKKWVHEGQTFRRCWFGNYKTGFKGEWKSYGDVPKLESDLHDAKCEEAIKAEAEERTKYQGEAALEAEKELQRCFATGSTPYMVRKRIDKLYGALIMDNGDHDPILSIPMRDIDGKIWNYQRIYAQKLSHGDKFFKEGARIEGCFHILNGPRIPNANEPIYVCEGFATAATVHRALGEESYVVCAFNAGNLEPVATALNRRYPANSIVLCADNDAFTVFQGKSYNVGIEKARRAAAKCKGKVVYPIFKTPQKGFTDFNDLEAAHGLDLVRDQILNHSKYQTELEPLPIAYKGNKPILPSEHDVAQHLLAFFKGRVVKQDTQLFRYCGTHWIELTRGEIDKIKQSINACVDNMLGSRDLEAYFKTFSIYCPEVPKGVDLNKPNPFVANFKNGTLILGKDISFIPHTPDTFVTYCLPFDLPDWKPGEELPPAPMFDKMIEGLWANNSDKASIISLSEELIGACLTPAYPNITIFFGPPGSGKSTFIKLMVKLVSRENTSSVQMCHFSGFNMESMVGKLVNFDTDIDVNRPINDSAVKKIIDRMPATVHRKFQKDVVAWLPAVHLFAGNALPKSLDGASKAYERRFILVETNSLSMGFGEGTLDYEDLILREEMPGVLARGLRGLYRLHANRGYYTVPESSKSHVRAMQLDSDIIGQFIEDLEKGEVGSELTNILESGEELDKTKVWENFKSWQAEVVPGQWNRIGRNAFYKGLEARGFKIVKVDQGKRVIRGFKLRVGSNAIG